MAESRLAIWALPGQPWAAWLTDRVESLARRRRTPAFEPHMTLICGRSHAGALLETLSEMRTVELQVHGLAWSPCYTRTLYIELVPTPELLGLRRRLAERFTAVEDEPFVPHVSLIYGGMAVEEREEEARAIRLPFRSLRFDALAAVAVPEKVESAEDVAAFRVLSRLDQGGSSRAGRTPVL